jgi:hypothetical protein
VPRRTSLPRVVIGRPEAVLALRPLCKAVRTSPEAPDIGRELSGRENPVNGRPELLTGRTAGSKLPAPIAVPFRPDEFSEVPGLHKKTCNQSKRWRR